MTASRPTSEIRCKPARARTRAFHRCRGRCRRAAPPLSCRRQASRHQLRQLDQKRTSSTGQGDGEYLIEWDALEAAAGIARRPQTQLLTPQAEQPPLPFIDMSNWDSEDVPQQQWTVFNRIPRRQVTLFSGEGAAGKSTIQLQL